MKRNTLRSNKAFTLTEVLITIGVSLFVCAVIVPSMVETHKTLVAAQQNQKAMRIVKERMMEIMAMAFDDIQSLHKSVIINPSDNVSTVNGTLVTYVKEIDKDLLSVTISVSHKLNSGHISGEDTNLDGILDENEDKNGNGQLDSFAKLITGVYNYGN